MRICSIPTAHIWELVGLLATVIFRDVRTSTAQIPEVGSEKHRAAVWRQNVPTRRLVSVCSEGEEVIGASTKMQQYPVGSSQSNLRGA